MNRFLKYVPLALLATFTVIALASAQSNPGLVHGQVPTATQWNSYFSGKQDLLPYTPVNQSGDTMTGRLISAPSTTSHSSFRIPVGVAPSAPGSGDFWMQNDGFHYYIQGMDRGPMISFPHGRVIVSGATDTAAWPADAEATVAWNSSSTSAKTQNLPPCDVAHSWFSMLIVDEKGDAATHTISITPNGTDNINGVNSALVLSANHARAKLQCEGSTTNWMVIAQ